MDPKLPETTALPQPEPEIAPDPHYVLGLSKAPYDPNEEEELHDCCTCTHHR